MTCSHQLKRAMTLMTLTTAMLCGDSSAADLAKKTSSFMRLLINKASAITSKEDTSAEALDKFIAQFNNLNSGQPLPLGFNAKPNLKDDPHSIYGDIHYLENLAAIIKAKNAQGQSTAAKGRAFGSNAISADSNEFVECVAVGRDGDFDASGIVIANDIILTAAHVWDGIDRHAPNQVWLGRATPNSSDADESGTKLRVARYLCHESYRYANNDRSSPLGNDLLLLQLTPESRAKIKVAAVMADPTVYSKMAQPNVTVRAVGFGNNRLNSQNEPKGYGLKRYVTIPMASENVSRYGLDAENLHGASTIMEFAAASKSENLTADTCTGDSGGPIYWVENGNYLLVGLTSRSTPHLDGQHHRACGDGGVYEKVVLYKEWIDNAVAHTTEWPKIITD